MFWHQDAWRVAGHLLADLSANTCYWPGGYGRRSTKQKTTRHAAMGCSSIREKDGIRTQNPR